MEGEQKLINFRPLFFAAAYFAAGIACAYCFCFKVSVAIILTLVFILLSVFLVVFGKNRKQRLLCVACFVLLGLLGGGYSYYKIYSAAHAPEKSGRVTVFATIDGFSSVGENVYKISFRNVVIDGEKSSDGIGYIYESEEPILGERRRFDCSIANTYNGEGSNFEVFRGKHYSFSHLKDVQVVGDEAMLSEKAFQFAKTVLKSGMSTEAYGLSAALLLGDTSMIGDKINVYRMAGIAHVFAVSGLHVGLFFSIFAFIAAKLKLKRLPRLIFILIPTLFYCLICGFRPSSVRALIMATISLLAVEIGFKRDSLSSISVALVIVLCIQPFYLFDVGTQLSFLAVLGITSLAPMFKRGAKPIGKLGDVLSVSLGASLGTLPILVDMSGYMSVISLFANIIFVPLLSVLYQFTVICLFGAFVECLIVGSAAITLFLPSVLLTFVGDVVAFFDFSLFTAPVSFGFAAFFYYFGLFFVTDYLNISKTAKTIIAALALVLMLITMFA